MQTKDNTQMAPGNASEIKTKRQTTVTLRSTDHRGCFAHNTHRVILRDETETDYFAWPDPTDPHNSPNWKPGTDLPLQYPKFAWEPA